MALLDDANRFLPEFLYVSTSASTVGQFSLAGELGLRVRIKLGAVGLG